MTRARRATGTMACVVLALGGVVSACGSGGLTNDRDGSPPGSDGGTDVQPDVHPDAPVGSDTRDDVQQDAASGSDARDGGMPIDPSTYNLREVACADVAAPQLLTCPALCGNGVADTCSLTSPSGQIEMYREVCDGTLPADTTCASLGYNGGQLACGSWCGYDVSGCTMCGDDAHVAACRERAIDRGPLLLDDVATDGARAALVLSGTADFRVAFAGADLTAASPARCFAGGRHTIAHMPEGWMLAAEYTSYQTDRSSVVALTRLDPDGNPRGDAKLVVGYRATTLAERPGAGPVLVGYREREFDPVSGTWPLDAMQLDAAGNVLWTAHVLDDDLGTPPSVVATPGGFLVAGRLGKVVKVRSTGTVAATHAYPFSQLALLASSSGSEARLSWVDTSLPGVYLARLDADGAPIGSPVVVAQGRPDVNQPLRGAQMVSGSWGTIVLLPGFPVPGGGPALAAVIVDDALRVTAPPFAIARMPLARGMIRALGSDVIVAWSTDWPAGSYARSPARFDLARLTP